MNIKETLLAITLTCSCYLLAALDTNLIFLLPGYYIGLWLLTKAKNTRIAFYTGLISGFIIAAIQLRFFTAVFHEASIVLWAILALWCACFTAIGATLRKYLQPKILVVAIPSLHFILEIIMCEIYPLKFTWLSTGFFSFKNAQHLLLGVTGIYGFSLLLFLFSLYFFEHKKVKLLLPLFCGLLFAAQSLPRTATKTNGSGPIITGIQLEFPDEKDVLKALVKVSPQYPQTDIFLMSEYTFLDEVPKEIKDWCQANQKYFICGSKIFTDKTQKEFLNSATVINPQGQVEFTQTKCMPIQFFDDGLPAKTQKLWKSPWGKIGLCICYDLSYASVTDELIKLGAQALIVPTMDVESWGENQHFLHSRVGPVKSVEYGIPIFKVSSSGISQFIDAKGQLLTSAPYPGQGEVLSAQLPLAKEGSRPLDRLIFYPIIIGLLGLIIFFRKEKLQTN